MAVAMAEDHRLAARHGVLRVGDAATVFGLLGDVGREHADRAACDHDVCAKSAA